MGCQDGVKRIRYKEVCFLSIGVMHVYYSIYFYYLLLFVIQVLSLHKLGDLLMYLSGSMMYCISAELSYVHQTIGVWIGKQLPKYATTNHTTSHNGLTKTGSCYKI